MSRDDVRAALALIEQHGGGQFAGPRPAELVDRAEEALGVAFPPSFRLFVETLGAGDIAGAEVYGVTTGDFEHAAVPNGVWLTLAERADSGLPDHLVLVYATGDGSYYALDCAGGSGVEGPVVVWVPGRSRAGEALEPVAEGFGPFLRGLVRDAVEA